MLTTLRTPLHRTIALLLLGSGCLQFGSMGCQAGLTALAACGPAGAAAAAAIQAGIGLVNACMGASPGDGTTAVNVTTCIEQADGGEMSCTTAKVPNVCAPKDTDTSCSACVKSACCDEARAWVVDPVATCLVGEGMQGEAPESAAETCGGGPDDAYTAFKTCVDAKCAAKCTELGL
jgi:hypothetical protein